MNRSSESTDDCPPPPEFPGALVRELQIVNRKGLHARATAKFVQCAEAFDAEIQVTRCGETVGGTSIMGILTLGAGPGMTITVAARGADAQAALDAIAQLVANRFGEEE
ncbi:MAG TPA: HPr family phosphocarrier protein [Beijerinckiaceae bacterium]|jgi:phosphocarrier protein|nr:HPr family phosphocarrier protein [Beijerinckiaceae bacterium]